MHARRRAMNKLISPQIERKNMSYLNKCNECGTMVPSENIVCHNCGYALYRKVSRKLLIACIIMPAIFCWFLLRKGYSKRTKIIGLVCGLLGVTLVLDTISTFSINPLDSVNQTNIEQTRSEEFPSISAGDYPSFENEESNLAKSVKSITGNDYSSYISNFMVVTPFVSDNGILHCNAAKQHSFGSSESFLAIDPNSKIVQAAFIEDEKITVYIGSNSPFNPLNEWIQSTRTKNTEIIYK